MSFCSLIKEYLENWHVVFCPNKQPSFEPLLCLDCNNVRDILHNTDITISIVKLIAYSHLGKLVYKKII